MSDGAFKNATLSEKPLRLTQKQIKSKKSYNDNGACRKRCCFNVFK